MFSNQLNIYINNTYFHSTVILSKNKWCLDKAWKLNNCTFLNIAKKVNSDISFEIENNTKMLRNRTTNTKLRWVKTATFVLYNNLIIWSRHYVHRVFTSQSIQQLSYTYWDQVLLWYYCVKTPYQWVTKRWNWRWIHSQKIWNLTEVVRTNLYIIHSFKEINSNWICHFRTYRTEAETKAVH